MKKQFPTFIHESAATLDYIYISAGQRGLQAKLSPAELAKYVKAEFVKLV